MQEAQMHVKCFRKNLMQDSESRGLHANLPEDASRHDAGNVSMQSHRGHYPSMI